MEKAIRLIKVLTEDYTKPISEKYVKTALQVSTLEERIKTFSLVGMPDRAKELNAKLILLIEEVKKEFKEDNDV